MIANERLKSTATLLNSAASGIIVTAVVAPVVAALYGVPGPANVPSWQIAVISLIWLATGIGLHLLARQFLGRLR